MSNTKIIKVKIDTLNALQGLKVNYKITSYDEVISELIRMSYSKEQIERNTNDDLMFNLKNGDKKILNRIEALHTRIGYFEKDYFLKIDDISDKIDDISIDKKSIKPIDKNEKNIDTSDEKKYRKQIEDLEISHQEIEKINEKLYKKLNLLNSKFIKKTGVFASGYELNLTTEEYQKIFE